MMLRAPNDQLAPNLDRYKIIGAGDDFFTVRAIKRADRWRPRLARRLAARALHRQAR